MIETKERGDSVSVTVKKMAPTVYEHLKNKAERSGRSLNTEILQVLAADAAASERRQRMRETRKDLEAFVAKLPKMGSSAPLIREDRDR